MKGTTKIRRLATALLLACTLAATSACGWGGEARKARHVEQGQKFMAERNYTKARIEFRNAQQIDPKDASVRSLVGFTSEKLGEYNEAVKAYRLALSTDETLVMPRARLARILALAGLDEEASELVTKGLELAPQSAELLSVRAVLRVQQGDAAGARQDAEQAYAAAPTDPDVVSTLAGVRWRAGERDEAIAAVGKAIEAQPEDLQLRLLRAQLFLSMERLADAEVDLIEVVRLDPTSMEQRNLLGRVYLQQQEPDAAIELLREGVQAVPESVEAKVALAQLIAAHRSLEEAERLLEEYRKAAPKDQVLSLAVADFYAANGRLEQAESIYRSVIAAPSTPTRGLVARNRMASVELGRGNVDVAAKLVGEVLAENPSDTDALATRAEVALRRGDVEAAVSDLRVAFSAQPDSVPIAVALARAHVRAGQNELAEQALRSVISTSPRSVGARFALAQFLLETDRERQARTVLEQLVTEQPANVQALAALGRLQVAAGDAPAALSTAATIQALQPGSASGHLLAGQANQSKQRNDDARKSYEKAAAAEPTAIEPLLALTRLDVAEGRPETALARLDEGLGAGGDLALLQALRGDVLMAMGRPADATSSYAAAVKAAPGLVQPYRGQAAAFILQNQPDKAIAALKSGVDATKGAPQLAMELASLYVQFGRIDDAAATYEAMLVRDPNEDAAANNLAMLLATHRPDAASLERASQLAQRFADSEHPAFLDTFGWVAYRRGRHEEAASALQKAVDKAPEAREVRYHLGMTRLALGQRDEARRNLEVAVSAGPEYPGIDEARKALQSL